MLLDAATGDPSWGVEYRIIRESGRTLVSLVNLLEESRTVRLKQAGKATDLISGRSVDLRQIPLRPMEPLLLEINRVEKKGSE
jgi:hypothetical protein